MISWLRVMVPVLALGASFVPWVIITGGAHPLAWNAYQLSPASWAWAILDAMAAAWAALPKFRDRSRWLRRAWLAFAAGSLGVGLAGLTLTHVAGTVSAGLGAPNPVALGAGLPLFIGITLGWTVLAVFTGPS